MPSASSVVADDQGEENPPLAIAGMRALGLIGESVWAPCCGSAQPPLTTRTATGATLLSGHPGDHHGDRVQVVEVLGVDTGGPARCGERPQVGLR